MSTKKPDSNSVPQNPEEALQELLKLSMANRRAAVARDVGRRAPRYRDIPAHDLAKALGVPNPGHPGADWEFTTYAEIMTVEEYVSWTMTPVSELIYLIEDSVDPERFQQLSELSESLDDDEVRDFSFLRKEERESLELAIAEQQLERNSSNGICCIAQCSVETPTGHYLQFEGDIEDDGTCIHLRTPYDKRAGKFCNLTNCLAREWWG